MINVGANIRVARKECGHTQESLARVLGLTHRAVGQWEQGSSTPSRRNLEALAAELGQEPAWFYAEHAEIAA